MISPRISLGTKAKSKTEQKKAKKTRNMENREAAGDFKTIYAGMTI